MERQHEKYIDFSLQGCVCIYTYTHMGSKVSDRLSGR